MIGDMPTAGNPCVWAILSEPETPAQPTTGNMPAAFDGGYTSRDNLARAKAPGVRHVVFHKKSGLRARDMRRPRGCTISSSASAPASPI